MTNPIKARVSECGMFATPINPHEKKFTGGSYNFGQSKSYHQFNIDHPPRPLTSYQTPFSEIEVAPVWMVKNKTGWTYTDDPDYWKDCGFETKQFYDCVSLTAPVDGEKEADKFSSKTNLLPFETKVHNACLDEVMKEAQACIDEFGDSSDKWEHGYYCAAKRILDKLNTLRK